MRARLLLLLVSNTGPERIGWREAICYHTVVMPLPADTATSHLELLSKAPFFGGLPPDVLQACLDLARERQFARQSYLFHEGDPATVFYVVVTGRIRLTQVTAEGQQVIVSYMKPGSGIGIVVALGNMSYPVSAEVVEECTVLVWRKEDVQRLMFDHPQLAVNGMKLLASRFVELQHRFRELATERVERRVARAILRMVRQAGKRTDQGVEIDFPLSRQDLAEMTGTTVYTVSRILSSWEQQGMISTGRERIALTRSHELVVIAEDLPTPLNKPARNDSH